MTQPSRTTETINRDNAGIRDIMHQIRDLTVPDRATLALGLVGHLATMMNHSQMAKLMDQLQEEAERVQDVPPSRQREDERARESGGIVAGAPGEANRAAARAQGERSSRQAPDENGGEGRAESRDQRAAAGTSGASASTAGSSGHGHRSAGSRNAVQSEESRTHEGVGQGGRGEFRSRKLL